MSFSSSSSSQFFIDDDHAIDHSNELIVTGELVMHHKRPSTATLSIKLPKLMCRAKETSAEHQLKVACSNNNSDLVRQLLKKFTHINVNRVYIDDIIEDSLLHYSAAHGKYKMCKVLLDYAKADPNCLNRLKQTPLHLAVRQDKLDCAELLIYYGANPYLADVRGLLPHNYSPHPARKIKTLLLNMEINPRINNVHLNSLHSMATYGNLTSLTHLLIRQANSNKLNKNGVSPLHLAMLNGQLECADTLVKYNAYINHMGNVRLTPLDLYFCHILVNNHEHLLKDLLKRLQLNWKFSSSNTFLLLLNGNLNNLININPVIHTSANDLVKLFDDFKRLLVFISFLRLSFKFGINLCKDVFIEKNDLQDEHDRPSDLTFVLDLLLRALLSFTVKVLRLKINRAREFDLIFGKSLEKFDSYLINLLIDLVFDVIKSGELGMQARVICYDSITKWFYENYSLNNVTTLQHDQVYDYCYEYFENLTSKLYDILSASPLTLQDLCRIRIKFNLVDYPNDLKALDSVLHTNLIKFLKFEMN